ncbi:MAG: hypothetical protein J5626_00070 [Lachnospiraceae bacterium]|nr:hypothetical protein [Lachnospiraceae bacterium]
MKFKSISGREEQSDVLRTDYESGTKVGIISLGNSHLFFRKFFSVYYISYTDLSAAYRRVYMMNGRKNSLSAEYLVLVSDGKEIANIGVPGTKSAREILETIKEKAPHVETVYKGEAV